MKTPKEKAQQLVARYMFSVVSVDERVVMDDGTVIALPSKMPLAKQVATQTVNEIIDAIIEAARGELSRPHEVYWDMVRREIEAL